MDKARAKELLRAIHSCQDSGCEDDCEAACAMLESDPELQRWFEEEMGGWTELDEEVAKKFDCCKAPEEEKETCKSKACACVGGSGLFRFLVPAMAAAALFVVGFFLFSEKGLAPVKIANSGSGLDAFRGDMAGLIEDRGYELHHRSAKIDELKTWLVSNEAPAGTLKTCVVCKEGVGCAVLAWGEEDVSMICFRDDTLGGGGIVHLFVIEREKFEGAAMEALVASLGEKRRHRGLETGGWVTDDKLFLVVGDDPEVSIDSLL